MDSEPKFLLPKSVSLGYVDTSLVDAFQPSWQDGSERGATGDAKRDSAIYSAGAVDGAIKQAPASRLGCHTGMHADAAYTSVAGTMCNKSGFLSSPSELMFESEIGCTRAACFLMESLGPCPLGSQGLVRL